MPSDEFGLYYEATYPRVWSYLRRFVPDAATASDLAQDTFVRLLQSGRDSLPEEERTAYLFGIATNRVRDHWKAGKRSPAATESDLAELSSNVSESACAIASVDVARALKRLPLRQRSIVWLAYAEGYDHATIARAVGVGEKSVKVMLFRARKKLMEMLGGRNG